MLNYVLPICCLSRSNVTFRLLPTGARGVVFVEGEVHQSGAEADHDHLLVVPTFSEGRTSHQFIQLSAAPTTRRFSILDQDDNNDDGASCSGGKSETNFHIQVEKVSLGFNLEGVIRHELNIERRSFHNGSRMYCRETFPHLLSGE